VVLEQFKLSAQVLFCRGSRAGVSGEDGEDQQAQQDGKRQVWIDARVTLASEEKKKMRKK
jgi:hypothetical protein